MRGQALVVGGGPSGLIAARQLALRGVQPLVLEAGSELGGALACTLVNNEPVERFYHHLLPADLQAVQLLRELELIDRLRWLPGNTALWDGRELYPLSGPLDLLRLPLLEPGQRLAALIGMLRARFEPPRQLLDRPLEQWVPLRLGPGAWKCLWRPLLEKRLGKNAGQLPASWLAWRLARRSSGGARLFGRYGVLDQGCDALVQRLAAHIKHLGGELRCAHPVTHICRIPHGWRAEGHWGRAEAESLVLALPPAALAAIKGDLPQRLRNAVASVPTLAAAVALVEAQEPFIGRYWTNSIDPQTLACGVVEHSALVGAARYGGTHLAYVPYYAQPDDRHLALPDEQLAKRLCDDLLRICPARPRITGARLFRQSQAHALRDAAFVRAIPELSRNFDGLVWASDALAWPDDRGLDACVIAAHTAVTALG
ncbi:MAG: FAD-dependent oxidoreductase [Candidatus Alcyoniella australis]|nr:FAD-dependent oxidoreductase [Candidatus Alcyoniella australis]